AGAVKPPEPATSGPPDKAAGKPVSPEKPEKPEYKITRPGKIKPAARPALQPVLFSNFRLPPIDLLKRVSETTPVMDSKEVIAQRGALIETTLKDFEIDVQMGEITQGATITRFEVIPSPGVKVERIVSLQNNLSLALKAERVNILAPVAGKGTVGIEVANTTKAPVIIRELIASQEFQSSKAKIPLALGKDVYGKTLIADLADMPHLLIAGSTGSGKSVCINCIISSILYRFSPEDMRLILIDPKVVELQVYNSLPHLIVPVVSDSKKVIVALRWVIQEMEKRYRIMAKVGVRNISAFNSRVRTGKESAASKIEDLADLRKAVEEADPAQPMLLPEDDIPIPQRMPFIVVFIDELADLMLIAPVDAEDAITRVTQMARAAGIHLVVATQTPRADIVTGTIKTNLPSKISFRVASKVDSRVILDENGAENLLGKGDMIYKSSDSSTLRRAQGAFVSDDEVRAIVEFCAKQIPASYDAEIQEKLSKPVSDIEDAGEENEELVEQCIQVIRQEGRASTSLLQRRLRIGYTRAARIMDILEERGVVGPVQGAKDREILIRLDGAPPEA
ncbi:MAG: DNA translocase FtsK, partial [Verrucomicrobia bacterium]|nr:DNA translocase FtsK [Verrucomicrobiota bacterium]